jgi:hypothetical protein
LAAVRRVVFEAADSDLLVWNWPPESDESRAGTGSQFELETG